ncbi:hypothetical protein O3M35_002701 [Rhynocoris fuscipes]|uniref:Peptidase S1 domain-containing protein n=1 Tax=Rhynocoris fuscipes TaxID=488301 RepID=A0AAW1CMB1_9HEMI
MQFNIFALPALVNSSFWNIFRSNQVRIIGGRDAFKGEFPYQALIKAYRRNESFICGGSVISEWHILTAAHCVADMDVMEIKLGSTVISYQAGVPVFIITPQDLLIHENYDSDFMKNDIALIKLKYSLSFWSERIKPIRLPRLSLQIAPETYDNDIATVTGWGKIHDRAKGAHNILQTARVNIMPFWQCKYYMATMYYKLEDNQICTLYTGSAPCSGDSGGGLVIEEEDGIKTIIGIVSFGLSFCESGNPTVYTSVSAHLPWIEYHTGIKTRI